jgi:hypothetical protein
MQEVVEVDKEQVEEEQEVHEDDDEEEEEVEEEEEDGEEDDRIWEPPEEYVETHEGMPLEPGTRAPYQCGVSELPGLAEWEANGGVVTLIPTRERYILSQSYFHNFSSLFLIPFLVVHCAGPSL